MAGAILLALIALAIVARALRGTLVPRLQDVIGGTFVRKAGG